jgi:hypothetical protein
VGVEGLDVVVDAKGHAFISLMTWVDGPEATPCRLRR